MQEAPLEGQRDGAALLADDDDEGVGLLAESQGGAVAHAVGEGAVGGMEGEDAAGGDDGVAADDDAAVVERGAGEEDGG